jgi:hypothetical protein
LEQIAWVQDSAFGAWIRESSWALFACLIAHTLGMGFLAGTALAIDARVLGVGRRIPLAALSGLRPVMASALAVAVVSGVLLVVGYPAKALTNPVFYAKLSLVAVALWLTWTLDRRLLRTGADAAPAWAKAAAGAGLVLWAGAIVLGRLLAYTHSILLVN